MPKPPPEMKEVYEIQLPDDYLRAIGHVVVQWGSLEYMISLMIAKLINIELFDPAGFILTNHMTFRVRMDAIKTLAHEKSGEFPHLSKFKELAKRIEDLETRRNRVVHGNWGYDKAAQVGSIGRGTARGQLKTFVEEMRPSDIEALATEIGRANIDTMKVFIYYE